MTVLGATAVVCILGFIGIAISSGLSDIEKRNEEMQAALVQVHRHRLEVAKGTATKSKQIKIPVESKAVDLENYLGKITKDVGVTFPKFNRGEQPRGQFIEATGRIELKDITIAELKEFLQRVEANPVVVVRELVVKKDFRVEDKLDVPDMVVATYFSRGVEEEEGDEKAKEDK